MPRPTCRRTSTTNGSPPEYAVTAQIAQSKYAAQYARLVRILGGYRQQVRTLLHEPGANPDSGYHVSYHEKLPMQVVTKRWFPLWFSGFSSDFHR